MIKFLIGFDAAAGLSRAQSLQHYRDRHAPLVSGTPTFWRHVGGYVQNLAADVGGAAASAMDGVSELWFADWDTYDAAFAEPLYVEHIRPDEQRFADFGSLLVVFAHDVTVFGGGATPPVKLLRFLTRGEGVADDAFRAAWETRHASAMRDDPAVRDLASAYVQNRPLRRDDAAFAPSGSIDGVDEFWFDGLAALQAFVAHEGERATAPGSLATMIGSVVQVVAETRVVRAPPAPAVPAAAAGGSRP